MHSVSTWLTYQTALGPVWAILVTLVGLPLANEIVQRAKGTRAESLLQGLALFLLKLPALGIVIAKTPVLGDLLYVFAPRDKADLPTPLIAKPSTVVVPAVEVTVNPSSPPSPPAALALLLIAFSALSGCVPLSQCKTPIPVQVAKCQLEQNLIACGGKDGLALVPVILNVIMSLASGSFDPNALLAELEAQGFQDAPCILAAFEEYLLPVAPQIAGRVHDTLKLALTKRGAHGLVQVKLRNGKIVTAVVP